MRSGVVGVVCVLLAGLSGCGPDDEQAGPLDGVTDPPAADGGGREPGPSSQGGAVSNGASGGASRSTATADEPVVPKWSTDLQLEPEEFAAVEDALRVLSEYVDFANEVYSTGEFDKARAGELMTKGHSEEFVSDIDPILNDGVRLKGSIKEVSHYVSAFGDSSPGTKLFVTTCTNNSQYSFVGADGKPYLEDEVSEDAVTHYGIEKSSGAWRVFSRELGEGQCSVG